MSATVTRRFPYPLVITGQSPNLARHRARRPPSIRADPGLSALPSRVRRCEPHGAGPEPAGGPDADPRPSLKPNAGVRGRNRTEDSIDMRATDTPPRTAPRARTGPLTGQRRSWALAAVATVGAGATFSVPGVLNGTAAMNGSARGTAAVIVLLAVPALLAATVPGRAGSDWVTSPQATVIRLGAVAYLAYNSVLFAFATPFNELFLVYVAMLGLSVFTLFELGREVDVAAFERCRP